MVDSKRKKEKKRFSADKLFGRSLLLTFTPFILFIAPILKKRIFDRFPFLGGWGAWFFLVTTIGNRFFLFTGAGVYGFLLLTFCVMVLNIEIFCMIVYATFQGPLSGTLSSVLHCLDPWFVGLFFFQLIMLELVVVNTIPLSIPQVEESLVEMGGEELLADRGFHPPLRSLERAGNVSGTFIAAAVAGVLAGVFFSAYEAEEYGKIYSLYLEYQGAHGGIELPESVSFSFMKR